MVKIVEKLLRAGEGRTVKRLENIAGQVNAIEEDFAKLTDAELRAETDKFKQRLAKGETLDDLLPEAFAAVREASKRTLGKRHFDVQLMGGAALHQGKVAEMKTGEGKTLVATLPSYLNALTGKGVHVVTVNDYLAEYQSELVGRIHRALGLETGCILSSMTPEQRRVEYAKDITYGTNNEFGFDYLRDNMAWSPAELVQRGHNFAIVDEVDSILIDEARTPLIISGPADQPTKWYQEFARIAQRLERGEDGDPMRGIEPRGDYAVDEKKKTVGVLEKGIDKVEDYLGVQRHRYGLAEKEDQVGVVTGLAWTSVGGDLLQVAAEGVEFKLEPVRLCPSGGLHLRQTVALEGFGRGDLVIGSLDGRITNGSDTVFFGTDPQSFALKAVGILPIGEQFSLYGNVGFHSWDLDQGSGDNIGDVIGDDSATDPTYGIGGQFDFANNWAIRAQLQRYEFDNADLDEVKTPRLELTPGAALPVMLTAPTLRRMPSLLMRSKSTSRSSVARSGDVS